MNYSRDRDDLWNRIGFMQGRLSDLINGRIQSFPWFSWEEEIVQANQSGFNLMEWTIDIHNIWNNPLLRVGGVADIKRLISVTGVALPSITLDCFMQQPPWRSNIESSVELYMSLFDACSELGMRYCVVPLVDNTSLKTSSQRARCVEFLLELVESLRERGLVIALETDYKPTEVTDLLQCLPQDCFGINYDIGNSASLGYLPKAELDEYFDQIVNVHVKDRVRDGGTVPFGTGDADISYAVNSLLERGYRGNFILQGARSASGKHLDALLNYREYVLNIINE